MPALLYVATDILKLIEGGIFTLFKKRELRIHVFSTRTGFFSLIFRTFCVYDEKKIAILLSASELKRAGHQTNISSILVVSDLRFSPVERGDTGTSLSQPQIASYYRS